MGPRGVFRIRTCRWISLSPDRNFSTSSTLNSGHSRWSKIKHDKWKEDARISKERGLLSQEVYHAAKYGGGPDPVMNTRLAIAIANAKKGALNKTSIETAIAKSQGKSLGGGQLEGVVVEAMLPYGVAVVIEYQTESKNRVLQDIRHIIKRAGGTVTPTAFLFEKKGRIWFNKKEKVELDNVLEEAIEAGATDFGDEDGQLIVDTDPSEITSIGQRLCTKFGLILDRSQIFYDPKEESMVELGEEESLDLSTLVSLIEEDPGLQNIYMNAAS